MKKQLRKPCSLRTFNDSSESLRSCTIKKTQSYFSQYGLHPLQQPKKKREEVLNHSLGVSPRSKIQHPQPRSKLQLLKKPDEGWFTGQTKKHQKKMSVSGVEHLQKQPRPVSSRHSKNIVVSFKKTPEISLKASHHRKDAQSPTPKRDGSQISLKIVDTKTRHTTLNLSASSDESVYNPYAQLAMLSAENARLKKSYEDLKNKFQHLQNHYSTFKSQAQRQSQDYKRTISQLRRQVERKHEEDDLMSPDSPTGSTLKKNQKAIGHLYTYKEYDRCKNNPENIIAESKWEYEASELYYNRCSAESVSEVEEPAEELGLHSCLIQAEPRG